jgi:hypothetical protein
MSKELPVDPLVLRKEMKNKYREVALNPSGEYHFHTGGFLRGGSVMIRRYSSGCLTRQSRHSPG